MSFVIVSLVSQIIISFVQKITAKMFLAKMHTLFASNIGDPTKWPARETRQVSNAV